MQFILKTQALFETFRSVQIGSVVIVGPYLALIIVILLLISSLFYLKWYVVNKKVV